MNIRTKIIAGAMLVVILAIIITSNVSACGITHKSTHSTTYARTIVEAPAENSYNNMLFAATIAWSVDAAGNESFHQGPNSRKYNAQKVESKVSVPRELGMRVTGNIIKFFGFSISFYSICTHFVGRINIY